MSKAGVASFSDLTGSIKCMELAGIACLGFCNCHSVVWLSFIISIHTSSDISHPLHVIYRSAIPRGFNRKPGGVNSKLVLGKQTQVGLSASLGSWGVF
jgi:hypothetical protein